MDMRILIDMDGVLYDMNTIWYKMHNDDHGHIHELTLDNVTEYYVPNVCKAHGCPCNPHKYFHESRMWTDGLVLDNDSIAVTQDWINRGYDIAICTTTPNQMAANRKLSWVRENFPHLRDVFITTEGSIKSWITADVLIDDRLDNHTNFTGISIVYDQAWNRSENTYPRAKNWNHVQKIVKEADRLLHNNTFLYMKENPHAIIQDLLFRMIRNKAL